MAGGPPAGRAAIVAASQGATGAMPSLAVGWRSRPDRPDRYVFRPVGGLGGHGGWVGHFGGDLSAEMQFCEFPIVT